MANSIQVYNGKSLIVNDLDIIAVMAFALRLVPKMPEGNLLAHLAEQWKRTLSEYAPGAIDLELDKLMHSTSEIEALVALFSEIRTELSQYGEIVPASVLNEMNTVEGVKFFDYRSEAIVKAAKSLGELLGEGK
ncbi:hypothetical protein [Chthoniobacter flavus]|nr:hypothetical protein [Chthoniobacter flavus]